MGTIVRRGRSAVDKYPAEGIADLMARAGTILCARTAGPQAYSMAMYKQRGPFLPERLRKTPTYLDQASLAGGNVQVEPRATSHPADPNPRARLSAQLQARVCNITGLPAQIM